MKKAKQYLVQIVGDDDVLDSPDILKTYSQDESFASPTAPRLVVKPESVEEVQRIVQWANRTKTPLIPVSSGLPHLHGDTVPSANGTVIVDLRKMNQVVRIDRRNRMAIIQPGVTYGQLQTELNKEGLCFSMPLLPRANKSVITSLLEREPRIIPKYQWATLDPLRCLEVVWGDGEWMATGDAGNPQSLESAWERGFAQVVPGGPEQVDYYRIISAAQGSMGIVTWASVKCDVLPVIHKLCFVQSARLESLIDFVYALLRCRFGDELFLLNDTSLSSMCKGNRAGISDTGESRWAVLIGIAGRDRLPEQRVKFQQDDISDMARQYGLQLEQTAGGITAEDALTAILNPSPDPYWKVGGQRGCRDIFFLTTLDKTPRYVKLMASLAERYGYPNSEMGVYIQPMHQGVSCHCEFSLPFNPDDSHEADVVRKLYTEAGKMLVEQGAYFSRPYGEWSGTVYDKDPQTMALLKKIKGIFDPNNIMNPGKLCF